MLFQSAASLSDRVGCWRSRNTQCQQSQHQLNWNSQRQPVPDLCTRKRPNRRHTANNGSGSYPAANVAATNTAINVTQSNGIQVTVGVSPAGLTFMVDGVSYTATTTLTWPVGSQHTLSATSPQGTAGTQYTFASWSDGGALTHTVTASTSTTNYTVTFNTSYLLTTSANPSQGGTVSPVTGYFLANSSVLLTATANPGYTFTNWTGSVTSNVPSIAIAMTTPQSATANFTTIPIYTVNTNLDDGTGTAANCTGGGGSTCSLRDAIAAAAAASSGADIEFDPIVFAASHPRQEPLCLAVAGR